MPLKVVYVQGVVVLLLGTFPKPEDWSLSDMQSHTRHIMTWFLHVPTLWSPTTQHRWDHKNFGVFFESIVPFLKL